MARLNKNAQKWVEALESGKYSRGTGYLCCISRGKRRYCCLGVACDLYLKEHPDKLKAVIGERVVRYNNDIMSLPEIVMKWLGINDNTGGFLMDGKGCSLASINDDGKSFKEIAKIIRSRPERLFRKRGQ